jgi:HEAT repeat protein
MTAETLVQNLVDLTGDDYIQARDELLRDHADDLVPELEAKVNDSASSWQVRGTAEALLGWIRHTGLFEWITTYVTGFASSQEPVTPALAADTLARLGPDAVPRLIEILDKTHEVEPQVVLQALAYSRDSRAVAPLLARLDHAGAYSRDSRAAAPRRAFLDQSGDSMLRALILGTLGEIRHSSAAASALALAGAPGQAPVVRAAAALCLGRIGESRFIEPLMDLARSPEAALRASAFRAMGDLAERQTLMGDTAAPEGGLAEMFTAETDELAALELVGTLARLAGQSAEGPAMDALQWAADRHPLLSVRRAAKDAIR